MKQKKTISLYLLKSVQNKRLYLLVVFFLLLNFISTPVSEAQVVRKTKVEFLSSDSLVITADHYYSRKDNPYILLFHTEQSSRGEFDELAERFVKMQYNCLAVDLRSGNKFGFIKNETAERAFNAAIDTRIEAGAMDILAAIEYAGKFNNSPVVLLGSSSSASLCIQVAENNQNVKGIMAFSPGEFFIPGLDLSSLLPGMKTPIFVAGNTSEEPYLIEMFSGLDPEYKSFISPPANAEGRGISLLFNENPAHDEYWMAVLIFIKSLKNPNADVEVSDNPL